MGETKAVRGAIFHMVDDPWENNDIEACHQYIEDGILLIEDGKVKKVGPASDLDADITPDMEVTSYTNSIIMPGLIDNHIHFPQVNTIASYGEQLLEWLQKYIFPGEESFKDKAFADEGAEFFLDQLLREGTTTVAAYCSIDSQSVESLFEAARRKNMRIIAGKSLMDRNGPDGFDSYDTPESAYDTCKRLIEKWHGVDRLSYAVTPRYAPSCTAELLKVSGRLLKEYPTVYCQTHLCENKNEIKWVLELFPECESYLEVYEKFGLLGERTILGHCLHVDENDFKKATAAGAVFCPSPPSNLFLGSGLYKFNQAKKYKTRTALATDMGAGDTLSMLQSMDHAYKMAQLQNIALSPFEAFYMTTLGNAKAIRADDKIGNFESGKEADFIVIDLHATPLLEYRMRFTNNLMEKLFVIMMLGDDRTIKATYIMGEEAHRRN